MNDKLHLFSLPNEVFVQVLTPFTTRDLLRLTTVSYRFHALVLRILHYRLLVAASLREYKLIFECYHPVQKLTEPHVFCKYLGTDGLSDKHEGEGSLYENVETSRQLGRLTSLYSRFRPEVTVEERMMGTRLVPLPDKDLTVRRTFHIEESEDFSQLCVVINLVKVMPGTDLLLSAVAIEDTVVRLFRKWLREQAEHGGNRDPSGDCEILWVDSRRTVGLQVRVRERKRPGLTAPVLVHRDEDMPVSYEVDFEELHIRTTSVLLTLEQSLQEQENHQKAVIFTRSLAIG